MKFVIVSYQAATYNYRQYICYIVVNYVYYILLLVCTNHINIMTWKVMGLIIYAIFSLILILSFRHYSDSFVLFSGMSRTYRGLRKEFACYCSIIQHFQLNC